MDHFKKAWDHAQKAISEAAKSAEDGEEFVDDGTDPLGLAGLGSPEAAMVVLRGAVSAPGMDPALGLKLVEVSVALADGEDDAAVDSLNEFIDLVNERTGLSLTNEQARILRQSARVIIGMIETGP